eukprot:g4353.t1
MDLDLCHFCYETLDNGFRIAKLPCSHRFHSECVEDVAMFTLAKRMRNFQKLLGKDIDQRRSDGRRLFVRIVCPICEESAGVYSKKNDRKAKPSVSDGDATEQKSSPMIEAPLKFCSGYQLNTTLVNDLWRWTSNEGLEGAYNNIKLPDVELSLIRGSTYHKFVELLGENTAEIFCEVCSEGRTPAKRQRGFFETNQKILFRSDAKFEWRPATVQKIVGGEDDGDVLLAFFEDGSSEPIQQGDFEHARHPYIPSLSTESLRFGGPDVMCEMIRSTLLPLVLESDLEVEEKQTLALRAIIGDNEAEFVAHACCVLIHAVEAQFPRPVSVPKSSDRRESADDLEKKKNKFLRGYSILRILVAVVKKMSKSPLALHSALSSIQRLARIDATYSSKEFPFHHSLIRGDVYFIITKVLEECTQYGENEPKIYAAVARTCLSIFLECLEAEDRGDASFQFLSNQIDYLVTKANFHRVLSNVMRSFSFDGNVQKLCLRLSMAFVASLSESTSEDKEDDDENPALPTSPLPPLPPSTDQQAALIHSNSNKLAGSGAGARSQEGTGVGNVVKTFASDWRATLSGGQICEALHAVMKAQLDKEKGNALSVSVVIQCLDLGYQLVLPYVLRSKKNPEVGLFADTYSSGQCINKSVNKLRATEVADAVDETSRRVAQKFLKSGCCRSAAIALKRAIGEVIARDEERTKQQADSTDCGNAGDETQAQEREQVDSTTIDAKTKLALESSSNNESQLSGGNTDNDNDGVENVKDEVATKKTKQFDNLFTSEEEQKKAEKKVETEGQLDSLDLQVIASAGRFLGICSLVTASNLLENNDSNNGASDKNENVDVNEKQSSTKNDVQQKSKNSNEKDKENEKEDISNNNQQNISIDVTKDEDGNVVYSFGEEDTTTSGSDKERTATEGIITSLQRILQQPAVKMKKQLDKNNQIFAEVGELLAKFGLMESLRKTAHVIPEHGLYSLHAQFGRVESNARSVANEVEFVKRDVQSVLVTWMPVVRMRTKLYDSNLSSKRKKRKGS